MRLLGEDNEQLNKLLIICLLLVTGTYTFNGIVSANSTLAFTTQPPNIRIKETRSEASISVEVNVSSESTQSPILPTSTAENSEVEVTTDSGTTTLKESEMTTSYLSAHAARNAPKLNDSESETTAGAKTRLVNNAESEATSTMAARPTTEVTKLTTGYEVELTTDGHSARNTTSKGTESGYVTEITTSPAEITTNLDGITTSLEGITTNLDGITTNLDSITTNFDVTPNLEEATTNLAEIPASLANTTRNTEVMPGISAVLKDFAEAPSNTTGIARTLDNHSTSLVEQTVKPEESTTITAETTNQPETTTTQHEITTSQPEATTTKAPKAVTTGFPEIVTDGSTSRALTSPVEPSTTRIPASKNRLETNDIATVVWFILILDGNCTHLARGRQGQRESGLKRQIIENLTSWLDATKEEVTIPAGVVCTPEGRVHANLTLFQNGGANNISGRLKSLEDLKGPLFRFHGQEFYVYQILTADGFLNKEPDIPVDLKHTDVELLIYISVGATCAFLFLLAMTLVACKYCTCRDPKPFEFGEPPNANLRLEDYTLTRIPRPKVGYVEYCRGLTKRYCPLDDRTSGMVQPFDTSVVPLEDARAQDFHDGVIVRPSDIRRLGGSLGRAYHAGCCGGYRPANGYATDADGYCIHSTENLHRAHKVDRYVDKGVDNPNFY